MNKYPDDDFNKETGESIYFYTPKFYALDNFSAYIISIWSYDFQTSEHAFQWKKFAEVEPDIADQILHAKSPHAAQAIAKINTSKRLSDWDEKKLSIMEELLRAKLSQHERVKRVLLETGSRQIFESSPTDDFWGIGPNGDGRNELGKLWMKMRAELS